MDVRDSEKRESGKRTKEKIRELTTVSVERVWASQFSRYSLRKIGLSLQDEMVNVHRHSVSKHKMFPIMVFSCYS